MFYKLVVKNDDEISAEALKMARSSGLVDNVSVLQEEEYIQYLVMEEGYPGAPCLYNFSACHWYKGKEVLHILKLEAFNDPNPNA